MDSSEPSLQFIIKKFDSLVNPANNNQIHENIVISAVNTDDAKKLFELAQTTYSRKSNASLI